MDIFERKYFGFAKNRKFDGKTLKLLGYHTRLIQKQKRMISLQSIDEDGFIGLFQLG